MDVGNRGDFGPQRSYTLSVNTLGGIPMEKFINRENIKIFKQRLEATTDEAQRQTLLTLLAEEKAKSQQLSEGEAKTAGAGLKSHREVSR